MIARGILQKLLKYWTSDGGTIVQANQQPSVPYYIRD